MLNWHNGLIIHAGYDDNTYDGGMILFVTIISLVVEFITDYFCWRLDNPRYNFYDAWSHMISDGRYWRVFIPNLLFSTLFAYIVMIFGFAKNPHTFASEPCYFVEKCLPHPCDPMCFSLLGPVQTIFNNVNITFAPPPFFKEGVYNVGLLIELKSF